VAEQASHGHFTTSSDHHGAKLTSRDGSVRVSVVLAVHNGLKFLPLQVSSVLDQLRHEDELIVIDDASGDGSPAWVESLADGRISLHRHAANLGVIRTFEHGLSLAQHDIVFLCDQDDVWLPGKREAVVQAFNASPRALVVVSDAQLIDAQGVLTAPSFMATRGGFRGGLWSTLWRNRYLGCAMAVRRELLRMALPIPHRAPMHDMWLGVLGRLCGRVQYIPMPLLSYRRHGGNVSPAHHQSWARMLRWRLALLAAVTVRMSSLTLRRWLSMLKRPFARAA
jgi:glycosyltransferase involved in cell wall biosynthesis